MKATRHRSLDSPAPAMIALPLRFATSNADKVREFGEWLGVPVEPVHLELEELQSTDLETVVRHKLRQAYEQVRGPVLVEDTALRFLAWGALPGPFIKHFIENMGLIGLVDALSPSHHWGAEAACGIGFHDGTRIHYFEGRVPGMAVLPMGDRGWGWDPIFRPQGSGRTFAEMPQEEKRSRSMRGLALRKLADFLREQNGGLQRAAGG
jgi:non-canonical purine NTP pyrophosphatase (RdgB/HAM1 family)